MTRDERITEVVRLIREGLTAEQIADRLAISLSTVNRDRCAAGVAMPHQGEVTPEMCDRITVLLDAGASAAEAARAVGCSAKQVRARFPDHVWTPPRRACSVLGCDGAHNARGFCRRHYNEFVRVDCSAPGCKNKKKYRSGLCERHEHPPVPKPTVAAPCPHECGRPWHPLEAIALPMLHLPACPGSTTVREKVPA